MEQFKDYYAILGISWFATNTQIRAAYLKRCKEWHPDKNPGVDTTKKMQDINEAKSILIDPIKRVDYDYKYNSFKTEPENQQNKTYTNQSNDNYKQERTKRNKQRYEELKIRVVSFKIKEHYLYETYFDQLKNKSTQIIFSLFENWESFSLEFIDMSIYELHESRKYGLDFIYSKIKEPTSKTEPIKADPKKDEWPWWASWLIFGLVNALIKEATTK